MSAIDPSPSSAEETLTENPSEKVDDPSKRGVQTTLSGRVDRVAALPSATRAALLCAAGGASISLGAFTAAHLADLPAIVAQNSIPWETRKLLTGTIGIVTAVLGAIPVFAWLFRPATVSRIEGAARRLSPVIPLSFVPTLCHWNAWKDAPFAHLLYVCLIAWGLYRSVLSAANAPPLISRLDSSFPRMARAARTSVASHLPTLIVVAGAVAFAAYFGYYTVQAHQYGRTFSYDLGIFDNLFWQIIHGNGFLKSTPAMGPELSHFGRHATLIAYVLAPFYALHPSASTLLVMQAVLLGAGAIPLYYLARRKTTAWAACVLAIAYLLYAPLHGSGSYDFHFLSISPVFIFALALAIEVGRPIPIVLTTLLVLSCREDVAPAVAILGAYHLVTGTKPRLGLALVLVGGTYFGLMKFALMPLAEGGEGFAGIYGGLLPEGGRGLRAVLTTIISNPAYTFRTVPELPKITYALHMLVPIVFLALKRPAGILFLAPGIFFTLLSTDFHPHQVLSFQYTAFWTPYVFTAAALFIGDPPFGGSKAHRRALLSALAFAAWATSYQWGGIFQHQTMGSGYWPHFPFEPDELAIAQRASREEILQLIPEDASVVASERVVPHVSNRASAYTLRDRVYDAEYLIIAFHGVGPREVDVAAVELVHRRMGVEARNRHFLLLKRGAPTEENERAFRQIARRRMNKRERRIFSSDDGSAP